ncbi:MAG: hypothetical protein OET18_02380 [Desulfobacterales bacterium]|jgi:hypothetical protein|nr:hypothetical protein [Desulfobacterales bacterium]
MAINVNTVYQTVLMILNKEQRGYMTPTEFNKVATQVQLEIFEKYFDDLNQQLRVPQADTDYADRQENIDEKIAIFKTFGDAVYTTAGTLSYFILPTVDSYGNFVSFYRLGNVLYNDEKIVQRLDRHDFYYVNQSKLTKPTKINPVYLYENQKLFVKPNSIINSIKVDYIRKPLDVQWGFYVGTLGQYITQPDTSVNFELHESEQTEVILKILLYAGIVIRDPQIVQAAAAQVQADEVNKKS